MKILQSVVDKWRSVTKLKKTRKNWISGNAICCIHNNETLDRRGRGGIVETSDGFTYNCFNCHFSTTFKTASFLSTKNKKFLSWLGFDDIEIRKLAFQNAQDRTLNYINAVDLNSPINYKPIDSSEIKPFDYWIKQSNPPKRFIDIYDYLAQRDKQLLEWFNFYYCNDIKNDAYGGAVIPFFQNNQMIGWSCRKLNNKVRYIHNKPNDYLYNFDMYSDEEIVFCVEGIFDAVNLNCVSFLGSNITEKQKFQLKSSGKKIVVFPDYDLQGKNLLLSSLKEGFSISLPPTSGIHKCWDSDIKDVSDAVARYGRLYTTETLFYHIHQDKTKIRVIWNSMFSHNKHMQIGNEL